MTDCKVCISSTLHDGGNVCEVQIDVAFFYNQVGNTLDTGFQNIICQCKRFPHRQRLIHAFEQFFIWNDNQGIDILFQFHDAFFCLCHLLFPFKCKRLCDNRNGQNACFLCNLCNDWSCTCTRTAAHAGSDEYHICTLEGCFDFFLVFFRTLLTDCRLISSTSAFCQLCTNLNAGRCLGIIQRLCIGIDGDIFNILYA